MNTCRYLPSGILCDGSFFVHESPPPKPRTKSKSGEEFRADSNTAFTRYTRPRIPGAKIHTHTPRLPPTFRDVRGFRPWRHAHTPVEMRLRCGFFRCPKWTVPHRRKSGWFALSTNGFPRLTSTTPPSQTNGHVPRRSRKS